MIHENSSDDLESDKDLFNEEDDIAEEDIDDDFDNYYRLNDFENDLDFIINSTKDCDPEYFDYECLEIEQVEKLLNESIENVCQIKGITPAEAKTLLYTCHWDTQKIKEQNTEESSRFFTRHEILPVIFSNHKNYSSLLYDNNIKCRICLNTYLSDKCTGLDCGHIFCKQCWSSYLEVQVSSGITIGIQCMEQDCNTLASEDFTFDLLTKPSLREKYQQFAFADYVKSHPQLRFCPGPNCNIIVYSKENKAKRVICKHCKSSFCYRCGNEYHAPTDCTVIKKWLTKCADDSETANYISAHTKDCPKCRICIEKNGGCNHMQCYSCKHEFCWMCLGDWKTHGSDYYECSRYKENPNIVYESTHAQAREALKKYLFYYERWDNHARSLRFEKQALEQIKERIHKKVMSKKGTWIDWQYLVDAAALLAKCRYTLQYTYPYAYYMECGSRKLLFEYQQAQLEAEIENLSWKVERAETWDRGDLENQMDIAEKRRATLLKDFFEN